MNVLITGAAGFLGKHFSRHHASAGHHIVPVDDLSSQYAEWPEGMGPLKQMDAGEFFARHEAARFDIVYHFAAKVGGREKIEGDPLYNTDSLRLDAALFRWATVAKPGVVVYPSSSAVYSVEAQAGKGKALSESDFDASRGVWEAPDEMYGFTKLVGEYLAWRASDYGVNTLCIRPFSGYGEGQAPEYPMTAICQRAVDREDPFVIWGSGRQKRDFIHVDDIVAATVKRVSAGIAGYQAMNIGTGIATDFLTVAKLATKIAGYSPWISGDTTKPVGVSARYCVPGRMLRYHTPTIMLQEGIERVMASLRRTDG